MLNFKNIIWLACSSKIITIFASLNFKNINDMKNLVVLNALDGTPHAINPDHITHIYKDGNECALSLTDESTFFTKIDFYNLVDLINKSYE